METLLVPILIASTVGFLVWGVACIVMQVLMNPRKRLQARLSGSAPLTVGSGEFQRLSIQHQATGLDAVLLRSPMLLKLHRRIVLAYPEMTLARFLLTSLGLGLVMLLGVLAVTASLLTAWLAGLIGGCVPLFTLSSRRNKRQRQIALQLPEAMDFLSRILRAGHSFSTGLQMMGDELPAPLADEFRRCYDQHSLGQPLEDSLKDMALRIESTDFAFFITAVLIQRQTGGDLSEVLTNISSMIRQRIRMLQQVKAKTAEGRFSGYILVAFPAVMFVISYLMNPQQQGVLLNTSTGRALLGTAVGLQFMGLFFIRRITNVKV